MNIAVYDTYVTKKDGRTMHFDILIPDEIKDLDQIYAFGKAYLKQKGQVDQPLTSKECRFCHIEQPDEAVLSDIQSKGFSIIEMEGCNT